MVCVTWWWLQGKLMGTMREMCSKRNPTTKAVSITCCIRQSAQILPDTESQLHFLCVSPFAVQKWETPWILRCRLEKGVRQVHWTGVQVSVLSQPGVHIMLHKNCLATTPPPPQNVVILLLSLYHNRRKKEWWHTFKLEIIPLSEAVLQPLNYTEYYKWKLSFSHLFHLILLRTSASHLFYGPFLAEYSSQQFETWANLKSMSVWSHRDIWDIKLQIQYPFRNHLGKRGRKGQNH